MESFSMTEAAVYNAFVARRLKADESVDAFVADLKGLAELSGHKFRAVVSRRLSSSFSWVCCRITASALELSW